MSSKLFCVSSKLFCVSYKLEKAGTESTHVVPPARGGSSGSPTCEDTGSVTNCQPPVRFCAFVDF